MAAARKLRTYQRHIANVTGSRCRKGEMTQKYFCKETVTEQVVAGINQMSSMTSYTMMKFSTAAASTSNEAGSNTVYPCCSNTAAMGFLTIWFTLFLILIHNC